jgi:hypothetical protein
MIALVLDPVADAQSRRGGGLVRALIAAGIAASIGKGGTAKPSEKDYGVGMLRPAQLKECLLTAHRLDLEDEELGFQSAKIDSENNSIATIKAQLDQDSPIPATNQFELDETNRKIDMFNGRVRTQKNTVEIYNQRVLTNSGEITIWNGACADHRFFLYDLDSVKADLPFSIEQYIKRESKASSGPEATSNAPPAAPAIEPVAETDCKSSLFGICTSRYTPEQQSQIDAQRRLEALLRDPVRAGPELERRLRKQIRYSNGLLLIEDPILHGITTLPATTGWSIGCGEVGIAITFGAAGEVGTEVELVPFGTKVATYACRGISDALGAAVLRLTSGQ